MEYITKSELFEYLGDKNSPIPNYGLIPIDGKINLHVNDECLIEFNNLDFNTINLSKIDKSILIRAGLKDLSVSFRPSSSNKPRFRFKLEPRYTIDEWLTFLLRDTDETFYLIPDTNFITNCYYTNFFQKIVQAQTYRRRMMIPRLTILELESQANRSDEIPKENLTDFEKLINKFEKLIKTDKSQTLNKDEGLKELNNLKQNFQKLKESNHKSKLKIYY